MAYRSKEDTINEARRLGIDVSGMSWPEMQKVVGQALKREELGEISKTVKTPNSIRPEIKALDAYRDKTILIAPELAPDANRIIRYEEEIGDDLDIEEKSFMGREGGGIEYTAGRDYTTGTYKVKGKTGRKVKAECSIPKENAQIIFRPGIDMFPVVTFRGTSGYLLTHHRLPNFKAVLKQSGFYEDYKSMLKDPPNVFYLTGLLCVDPHVAHNIMNDIERRVADIRNGGRGETWVR